MSAKDMYRVCWTLATTDTETSLEFSNREKAEEWAYQLKKCGARNVGIYHFALIEFRKIESDLFSSAGVAA